MPSEIKYCGNCKPGPAALFQNKRYGNGRRVHNQVTKTVNTKWRCTVCGNERE